MGSPIVGILTAYWLTRLAAHTNAKHQHNHVSWSLNSCVYLHTFMYTFMYPCCLALFSILYGFFSFQILDSAEGATK